MSISITRMTTVLLTSAATALGAAGCGDDEGSGGGGEDAKEIAAVVNTALTTKDPSVKCVDVVTKGFVRKVYGDLTTCKAAEKADDDDNDKPTGSSTSAVKIDGETATATVSVEGGDTDGSTGTLDFEKEDGTWKVSGLGADFLRSQLETSLAHEDDPGSAFATPAARECVIRDLGKLDDEEFRAMAYSGIAETPTPEFVKILTACASKGTPDPGDNGDDDSGDDDTAGGDDSASQSLLRRQFESGIRSAARKDGATDAQIDCVVKQLRSTISEDDIVEQVGRGKDNVSPELAQKTARAIQRCG
jgi:hypothetical protein